MTPKEQVHALIKAQDLIRSVWVEDHSSLADKMLRHIDRDCSDVLTILGTEFKKELEELR